MPTTIISNLDLQTVLDRLLQAHLDLEQALLDEQVVLGHRDVETLLQMGHVKQQRLEEISQLEHALFTTVAATSVQMLHQKVVQAIEQIPLTERLAVQKNWHDLLERVKKCKDLNQINAAIVQANLNDNRRKLNIINSVISTGIYDEKGSIL